jgi:hypothetical protein
VATADPVLLGPPTPDSPASGSGPVSLPINEVQARLVRVLMGLIMFVTGTYVGVDWAAFYYHFTSPFPAHAGYARTILCAIMVALIGPSRVDQRDARLLVAAFALALVADYCLILNDWMIPGTLLFLVVHALLIARHGRGFADSLAPPSRARSLRLYALTAVIAYGGAGALIFAVTPILERTHSLVLDSVYLLCLATSMWMAWGTLIRRFYLDRNAWYIAIGMTCFFFCDVTVGVAASLAARPETVRAGAVLTNVVGFFYSPALVLLAYSGYHWRSHLLRPSPLAELEARRSATD